MQTFPESHLLTLSGSPRQRGQAHGEALRPQIQEVLERWKARLNLLVKDSPETYIHELATQTHFQDAIERWTPGLLTELQGIAEGANVDFETLYGFQLQDEEWWFAQDRWKARQAENLHCSATGWTGLDGSPSLVAQTMDLPDYLDGFQVVLRIQQSGSDLVALVFSVAGLVALNGVNNRSIGVVCNNLGQLNHTPSGLPVAFVHRGILQQETFQDVLDFLQTIRHASGQNYLLGCPGEIVDLECSANQVAHYRHPGRQRSVCHTNHPFVNSDFLGSQPSIQDPGRTRTPLESEYSLDSRLRFESISQGSQEVENAPAGIETARRVLSSHASESNPVCRHPQPGIPWMTIGSTIMVLDEHPRLIVCPGPPCSSNFSTYDFSPA